MNKYAININEDVKLNLILLVTMLVIPSIAFAQSSPSIIITTDKPSYTTGDVIALSGVISSLGSSNNAVLQVYNSFNVLVQIATIPIASDGSFSTKIKAEGQSWSNDGSYTIKVLYVSTPILATTSKNIDFKAVSTSQSSTTSPSPPQTPPQTMPPPTQPPITSANTQNHTQITTSQSQDSVEEQIKKRIEIANKLKQELNQNGNPSQENSPGIPEFPFAMPVLLISIFSVIIFYRIKYKF